MITRVMANAYPFGDFDQKKTSLFLIVSNLRPGKAINVVYPPEIKPSQN